MKVLEKTAYYTILTKGLCKVQPNLLTHCLLRRIDLDYGLYDPIDKRQIGRCIYYEQVI